jgi:hypothetical protein
LLAASIDLINFCNANVDVNFDSLFDIEDDDVPGDVDVPEVVVQKFSLETRVKVCEKSIVKVKMKALIRSGKPDRSSDSQTARKVLTGLRKCYINVSGSEDKTASDGHSHQNSDLPKVSCGRRFPPMSVGKTFPHRSVGKASPEPFYDPAPRFFNLSLKVAFLGLGRAQLRRSQLASPSQLDILYNPNMLFLSWLISII